MRMRSSPTRSGQPPRSRRLTELHAGAIEDLVEILLDEGEWTAAIAALEPLIEQQQYRDRPRGLLMRALAESGRRIDALRVYQAYRNLLAEEVGTEPSEAITALDREIASSGATGIESITRGGRVVRRLSHDRHCRFDPTLGRAPGSDGG